MLWDHDLFLFSVVCVCIQEPRCISCNLYFFFFGSFRISLLTCPVLGFILDSEKYLILFD